MNIAKIITTLVGAMLPLCVFAASFPDVSEKNANYGAVEFLKASGIINGYPDGTFKPENPINRAEALKITMLALEYLEKKMDISQINNIKYSDVSSSDWFYNYVNLATNAEIVEGYPDGSFKPAVTINAAESLKIVIKTLDPNYQDLQITENPYTDVKSTDWFATFVYHAKKRNLVEATGNYQFFPDRQMSRAQFAELVYRLVFSEKNKLDAYPLSQNWQYCNNHWLGYKAKSPSGWQTLYAGDQMIMWRPDLENNQFSFARTYPNSAVLFFGLNDNEDAVELNDFVKGLDYGSSAEKQYLTLNGMPYAVVFLEESGFQDNFFKLENGKILAVYSQIGTGAMAPQLKEEIRYILGSVRNSTVSTGAQENCLNNNTSNQTISAVQTTPNPANSVAPVVNSNELIISQINSKVLVKGAATDALNLIDDEVILETDTLGIGTGPVDYHYSSKLNLTLKVERNSATILAVKKEKSTKF